MLRAIRFFRMSDASVLNLSSPMHCNVAAKEDILHSVFAEDKQRKESEDYEEKAAARSPVLVHQKGKCRIRSNDIVQ